ncbi:TPA: hypothetical protein DEG21_05590 [Patescibacteria group bacterium]|nr:hypothetical protein [Candidatus Gracilibacteria bacterium]
MWGKIQTLTSSFSHKALTPGPSLSTQALHPSPSPRGRGELFLYDKILFKILSIFSFISSFLILKIL